MTDTHAPRAYTSARDPDPERERITRFWDPGRKLLRALRRYQHWHARQGVIAGFMRRYWVLVHRYWSVICQCDIPVITPIGRGLVLHHPNGVVMHPAAVIGPNCMIFNQVTIGSGRTNDEGRNVPLIGGHVDIAAGARIVGGVTIGDHAVIGLNAVVLDDVPPGGVAVGVPARVIRIEPPPIEETPIEENGA
ncbi:serine O-acetyltransferase [Paracoccus tegillarcae]|uniref:Serine acetyltransferase n=1 Tax=Paracoccus tegillarcae TaxID=1529068 RepID=A0A2K9F1V7_9RHOB|nr:serine acetyltransferase [Paracoccus tegillarcae]AUH35544.1 serine acetyltransferase [Paracoccus tegillarcae]